jgi:hypothetical protein
VNSKAAPQIERIILMKTVASKIRSRVQVLAAAVAAFLLIGVSAARAQTPLSFPSGKPTASADFKAIESLLQSLRKSQGASVSKVVVSKPLPRMTADHEQPLRAVVATAAKDTAPERKPADEALLKIAPRAASSAPRGHIAGPSKDSTRKTPLGALAISRDARPVGAR